MKVYTPMNIVISYKLAQMENIDESAYRVKMNMDLINNVVKQEFGGAKPLLLSINCYYLKFICIYMVDVCC